MKIIPALIGSLPRPLGLAKKIELYNIGKLNEEKLEEAYKEYTIRAFRKLKSAGIKVVTDGMYRWDDIFNPLIGYVDGIEVNGLFKFYENNFFYRSPVVKSEINLLDTPIPKWISIAREILEDVYPEAILKAVLPGPVTLTYHSLNEYYDSLEALAIDYAERVLKPLIKELEVDIVELQEPALASELSRATREDEVHISKEIAKATIEELGKIKKLWVVTYFGTPQVIPEGVILNVDLVEGSLPDGIRGEVGFGVVNARETKMERADRIRDRLLKFSRNSSRIYVTPNTLLDFLSESVAWRKLRLLGRLGGG